MFHKEAVWLGGRVGLTVGHTVAVGTSMILSWLLAPRLIRFDGGYHPSGGARGFQSRTFVNGQTGFYPGSHFAIGERSACDLSILLREGYLIASGTVRLDRLMSYYKKIATFGMEKAFGI
jgi:hypothetical protein